MHQLNLAYCLIEKGHKVIAITHNYKDRTGVRYLQNGLKIYYCPFTQLPGEAGGIIFPMFYSPHMVPLLRNILIREDIDIVHWHQASSMLGFYMSINSDLMGVPVVRTNHSLHEIEDAALLQLNKLNDVIVHMKKLEHVICVSHAVRENEIIRSTVPIEMTSVIPNAIDCNEFVPDPSMRNPVGTINIVFSARMTYRKGVDFLLDLLPRICKKFPNVYWIIGGDGNKLEEIKFLVRRFNLEDRVEFLGMLTTRGIATMMTRGHIFLNTSITEAFCIAALEAASAGLLVVTTNVGGTPEVLPHDLILFSNPSVEDLNANLEKAITIVKDLNPSELHNRVRGYYSWRDIADRVEVVYFKTLDHPRPKTKFEFEKHLFSPGMQIPIPFIIHLVLTKVMLWILEIVSPASKIERAINFPSKKYNANKEKWGDHSFDLLKNTLNKE